MRLWLAVTVRSRISSERCRHRLGLVLVSASLEPMGFSLPADPRIGGQVAKPEGNFRLAELVVVTELQNDRLAQKRVRGPTV